MGLQKTAYILMVTLLAPLFGGAPDSLSGSVLYQIHRAHVSDALRQYLEWSQQENSHDFSLLRQMGLAILEEGAKAEDPEVVVLSMMGAGVSSSIALLPILEQGLHHEELQVQLLALHFLARCNEDCTDDLLLDALNSPLLLTRLEALYQLSCKRHPQTLEQLQSLWVKLPEPLRPLFAQILVNLDSYSANQMMRQMLSHQNVETRCQAILAVTEKSRDDFLPQIRALGSQTQVLQQECVAYALGRFKDHASIDLLHRLHQARQPNVRLAAAYALHELGDPQGEATLLQAAQQGDLLALTWLSKIPKKEHQNLFLTYLSHPDVDIRLLATLSLLEYRDVRCLANVKELLTSEEQAIGYIQAYSPGHTLPIWKTVFSAPYKQQAYPAIQAQSAALRAQVLTATLELGETAFLEVAQWIFSHSFSSLFGPLIECLSNHRSEAAIDLIKAQYASSSSEVIRMHCLLALCRLEESASYQEALIQWVKERHQTILIRFAQNATEIPTRTVLSPEKESALLIEAFETLASLQNPQGITALLHAIAYGNLKNRYALAGLLIRTAE